MLREHPLRIIRYSLRSLWLLLFPLVRSLLHFRTEGIRMERSDLFLLFLILGFGWLRWYSCTIHAEKADLTVHSGIFFRHSRRIPSQNLSALTLEYPLLLRCVGGVYLSADTASGIARTTDLRLLLRRQDAQHLCRLLPAIRPHGRYGFRQTVHPWRILLFSVIFSSSFSGAVYTATLWFQSVRIIGRLPQQMELPQRFSEITAQLSHQLRGIPPAAVAVGLLVFSTWFLSFVKNLLQYGCFQMETDRRMLFVRSGILTKRSFFLRSDRIGYIDIRQNLLTKLCRMYSLAISCPGYGVRQGTIPVCLPILRHDEILHMLPMLFPDAAMLKNKLRPRMSAFWSYVWMPVTAICAVVPTLLIGKRMFPAAAQLIEFLLLMALIPLLWKVAVQLAALLTSGVSITKTQVCLRFCRGFVFHTIIAGTHHLTAVEVRCNPFQRFFGKCDLIFFFHSEKPTRFRLRNVEYERAAELVRNIR